MSKSLVLATAFVLASGAALAAPVSGDFRAELSLPDFSSGVRVLEAIGEDVAGAPDLSDADEIDNPADYSGHANMDLSAAGLVTLTGAQPDGFANYDLAVFTISNIIFDSGEVITGFSATATQGLLDPAFDLSVGAFAPLLSFTSDSITISFDTTGIPDDSNFQFLDGGVSTFQIETSAAPVPLPAGLPLLIMGLGAFGIAARRKRG